MNTRILAAPLRGLASFGLAVGLCATAHAQTITTIAGSGATDPLGDGGAALAAGLSSPADVAVDAAGNRYIADLQHYRIRKVTPAGVISTVAGNGVLGFSGDGGPATNASIGLVYELAIDAAGNLYLPDYLLHRVRKVSPAGIITTIAGTGFPGYSGDGGPASAATLSNPIGVAVDAAGNLYVSEYTGQRIRRISATGTISTVAGNGSAGYSGDGGAATAAQLGYPFGIALDGTGNLYIAEATNLRVRKVTPAGVISTFAGNGTNGYSGDGGAATAAGLGQLADVTVDASGNVYLGTYASNRVRKVSPAGIISTFAGNGSDVYGGDGGPATSAGVPFPVGVTAAQGNLYITGFQDYHIRKVSLFSSCAAEGYSGAKRVLCHQICELPQSPTALSGLIKGWTTLYRSEPPCAR